jgi:hypothetical protein
VGLSHTSRAAYGSPAVAKHVGETRLFRIGRDESDPLGLFSVTLLATGEFYASCSVVNPVTPRCRVGTPPALWQ